MQNNIIRSGLGVNNPRNISTDDLHTNTNLMMLDRRKKFQLFVCVHKAVYNGYIPLKENVRTSRMFDALVVQLYQASCTRFKKTPLYLGGDHLNNLPVEIRNIEDLDKFKERIKSELCLLEAAPRSLSIQSTRLLRQTFSLKDPTKP